MCSMEGCERDLNRDGLCFYHKIRTVRVGVESIRRERTGEGPSGADDRGTRAYVEKMYADRRAAGLPDPEPANRKSAAFAPPPPIVGRKEWQKVNGG